MHWNSTAEFPAAYQSLQYSTLGKCVQHITQKLRKQWMLCKEMDRCCNAYRQTKFESKLIEALEDIWIIVHLDGNLLQASF